MMASAICAITLAAEINAVLLADMTDPQIKSVGLRSFRRSIVHVQVVWQL
jgi:hypothetical protein